MSGPLTRRMLRLETLLGGPPASNVLTLMTDAMRPGDDPAPFEAAALAEWRRNTGQEPPEQVSFTHFFIRGVKPINAEHSA